MQLPVIGYLRNPALKPRHWVKVEEILKTRFTPDTVLTLKMLEDLHAFQHGDELMEIAGQASSEFGLELLLKKVRFYDHSKRNEGIFSDFEMILKEKTLWRGR